MLRGVVLLCVCLVPVPASAQTTRDVLQDFGLVGTWSTDCAKDITKPGTFRATYAAPLNGAASMVSVTRQADNRTISTSNEIERAVRVAEQRIQLTFNPIEKRIDDVPMRLEGIFAAKTVVTMEKSDGKIRLLDSRMPDGTPAGAENGRFKNGAATPPLEKCLN